MGSEQSIQRDRRVPSSEDILDNFCPLRFHPVHGDNVKLRKSGRVACRIEGFCKGLAFSDRPVAVCEPIYIKFLEISQNWSGALRIGFTMHDPVSMKYKLPRYACPDLTAFSGNWAKAIAERMAKKDSVLYYYVDQTGNVHYGINSEEHGVFFGGVNTSVKLWAVIDIYGNTVAVEFIDQHSVFQENVDEPLNNHTVITRDEENQNSNRLLFELIEYNPACFHSLHGKNVSLKERKTMAARKPETKGSTYVFTERPLTFGEVVIFEVLQTTFTDCGTDFMFGITSCNPATLKSSDLPDIEYDLLDRSEYWIVDRDSNSYNIGDTIIFNINTEGKLTVSKNLEEPTSELHVDPTQQLWLFISISGLVSEIRFVGTSVYPDFVSKLCQLESGDAEAEPGPSGGPTITECVICYEESVDCVLYRCGHMCMCYNCAQRIWKPSSDVRCPLCREVILDIIKTYK